MDEMLELKPEYVDQPRLKVYTFNELGIHGLALLGWHHSHTATAPLPLHFHRDCVEITLAVQGSFFYHAEGRAYNINGGDVYITPANLPHSTESNPVAMCEIYWVQLNIGDPSFLFLGEEWAAKLRRKLGNLQTGVYLRVNFSRKYLSDMFSLLISAYDGEKFRGISRLVDLLHEIVEAQMETSHSFSADIQKAVDFINATIHDEIALEKLADEACLSLDRFQHKFQEQVGITPRAFINAQKIKVARKLLTEGKSITDVAFDLGFNSSAYFSTIFRKFTLISPSEFIRQNKTQSTFSIFC